MQVTLEKPPQQRPRLPTRAASFAAGDSRGGSRRYASTGAASSVLPSPRHRPACTCSRGPGSARCSRHGYIVPPGDRLVRRDRAHKEILRRALAHPVRRFSLRRWSFQPTPSRLSTMSTA